MILAGDVGGTKTNVGLFELDRGRPVALRRAAYPSREHDGLLPVVADFLSGRSGEIRGAAFGIAGPVIDNRCATPNLAWHVDGDEIAARAGLPFLALVNDLAATAEGIPALGPEDLAVLNPGEPDRTGTMALIAAGTGLGMCIVPREGAPLASEGGHASFAPRDEEEEGLRRSLARRFGRASIERVVSGPGLRFVYDHYAGEGSLVPDPDVRTRMERGDPAAVITAAAATGECPVCAKTFDTFLGSYGATAGDLALVALARGGLWIGGGIAPKILPALKDGRFLEAFLAKGRFRGLLEKVPVRVILNPETAVLGAARVAFREAGRR